MLGEEPTAEALDRLLAYLDVLNRWNQAYNLTAIRDPAGMVARQLLDSLSVLPWVSGDSLLDAGTGAGLPGVPLAIMRPGLQVTLLDSAGKKVRFLRQVKRELALDNIHPVQERLETYSPPLVHSAPVVYSTIISRAFSDLAHFGAAARHLMGRDNKLLAMKGLYPEAEIAQLPAWIKVDRVEKLFPPGLHEQRHLVIMSLPVT